MSTDPSTITPPSDPGTPPPSTPPAAPPATNWFDGAEPELIGHIQNLGWDKKTPNEAALLAAKSHREANKLIGVPPDQILRKPKDAADLDQWGKIYDFLGVPKEATDYDLSNVKRTDGKDLEPGFIDTLRKAAHAAKLPPAAAVDMAKAFVAHLDGQQASGQAAYAAKLTEEKAALKENWGANYQGNEFVAQQAALKLGVGPEAIQALEGAVGYAKVMEMFREIGVRTGEDRFVAGNGPGSGVMTKEMAITRLADLKKDPEWTKRWAAGGVKEKEEKAALDRLVAGGGN